MSDFFTHNPIGSPGKTTPGPLAETQIVFQPNLSVAGWPCEAGSRALAGYRAFEDATIVTRLTQAGARPAGSARMAELGFGLTGDTTARIVIEGLADLAVITDTLGEARVAAAVAGLYGFKPTHGLISRRGLIGLAPSLECPGLAARRLEPIAAALTAMAGPDPQDPSMPDDCAGPAPAPPAQPHRTALAIQESLADLTAAERRAFANALAHLAAAGLRVEEVSWPEYALFGDTHQVIAAVEASSSAGKYDGVRYGHRAAGKNWNDMYLNTRKESFGPLIKPFLFQGAYLQFENYAAFEAASRLRNRLVRAAADLFARADLLVLPTRRTACDAARAATVAETYAAFALTLPANVIGLPALQIPGLVADGPTDIGLQLIAQRRDDARLLATGIHLTSPAQEGN